MSEAYKVVKIFERTMAEFTGAPYAVSVESCSAALFLCFHHMVTTAGSAEVICPKHTYPSVASGLALNGFRIKFADIEWQDKGYYRLAPLNIIDSAKYLAKDMYKQLSNIGSSPLVCLSFHGKKCLKIGRGGMILTADEKLYEKFKRLRFDGRNECALPGDKLECPGFNMYLSCEQAARGLELFQWIKDVNIDTPDEYQDLSQYDFYTEANR